MTGTDLLKLKTIPKDKGDSNTFIDSAEWSIFLRSTITVTKQRGKREKRDTTKHCHMSQNHCHCYKIKRISIWQVSNIFLSVTFIKISRDYSEYWKI